MTPSTPLIFDFDRLKARPTADKLRYDLLIKTFGQLCNLPELPPAQLILSTAKTLPSGLSKEWKRAMAEELLLRHNCGLPLSDDWLARWKNIPPFTEGMPLHHYLRRHGACAVFPLAGNPLPGAGHLWIFKSSDKQTHIPAAVSALDLPADFSQVIEAEPPEWIGESYRLAAHLAVTVLRYGSTEMVADLAAHWLVTGRIIAGERIGKVDLGNKLRLGKMVERRWLLPADNRDNLPLTFPGRHGYRLAYDTESAWNQLTGRGIIRQSSGGWPEAIAFHSFTSGAREPVIAAALFTNTSRCHLWHTADPFSRKAADDIAQVVNALAETAFSLHAIDSADMAVAERQLMEKLQPDLDAGRNILFNVTQGNRLMSFAVHSVARRYENLLMIYRDLDALRSVFTLIRYEGGQPVTQQIRGDETRRNIAWDSLFFKPTPRKQEPWQKLLAELRKTGGNNALS